MRRTKWIERQFDFNFPAGVFPSILERLRGTPARLEKLTDSIPTEILTRKVDGKWSIQEHVGHLLDIEELHVGRLDDFESGLKVLRPADMTNKKTFESNHNSDSIQNLIASFRRARNHFVKRLDAFDEEMASRSALHPRLQKPMRVVDMAFFVAEHDDHHLASITESYRKFSTSSAT